jgi:hypothetical protein
MPPLRCLLGHHSWRYAIMPNQDVVSRACTRCHTVRVHPAEPIGNQLARIDDINAIRHLFTPSGWPR